MKKLLITLFLLFTTICINAQIINIEYIKGSSNGKCVEENHKIIFSNNTYTRIDLYDSSNISGPSKISQTGYDDNGTYWEKWSPRFYLEENGIDEFRSVYQYYIQVFYDKRGGDVIYIWERNIEIKNDRGKYFLTSKGGEKFCK